MTYKNRLKDGLKKDAGFTIIEVLIVLAIAGLILLIVFLAVPALQRNSRNTSMKNDVQNVLGGVSEFQGANNGVLPTGIASDGSGAVNYTRTGANATSIRIQGTTDVAVVTTVPTTSSIDPGQVRIMLQNKCNGTGVTSNTRAVAAFYIVETSSGEALQCSDS